MTINVTDVDEPNSAPTLVSNAGQTSSGGLGLDTHEGAQAFTTGDNSDGYTVTSVGLDMYFSSGANPTFNFTVGIWMNGNSNLPGSSLVTLTQPASLILGVNEFTTSGIELAANTTYWVVVDSNGGGNVVWESTAADSEDPTASGWSIADESYNRPYGGGIWNSHTDPFKLRVNGTAIGSTTNSAPVFTEGTSTTRSVAENTASGQNIGAPVTATDADPGDTLTYTLGGTDAAAFGIVSASGQLQTSAALDYETKASYAVTVSVSDGNGGADSINVTINVVTADRAALVALYNATGGADWTNNTNWLSNEALSEWHRVETDEDGRVTALRLVENALSGAIPAELGNLTNLQVLSFSKNTLSGEIPTELGDLTNLQLLYLNQNELSGEIPSKLGDLTSLLYLYLNDNALTGSIPSELGRLTRLSHLALWGNPDLERTVPAAVGVAVDRAALAALYGATGGASWTNAWANPDAPYDPLSDWSGVTTGTSGRVTHVRLENRGLAGPVPAAFEVPDRSPRAVTQRQCFVVRDAPGAPARAGVPRKSGRPQHLRVHAGGGCVSDVAGYHHLPRHAMPGGIVRRADLLGGRGRTGGNGHDSAQRGARTRVDDSADGDTRGRGHRG